MGPEENSGRPDGVMAPRLPDWKTRLDALIAAANRAPWAWGNHDCLAFAAKVVEAVTGEDLFEPYRGRYHDEAGAAALVPDVAQFMRNLAERQGWPEISAQEAQDGDLAIFERGSVPLVGAIYGSMVFPRSPRGLRTVSRFMASNAWAVGFDG